MDNKTGISMRLDPELLQAMDKRANLLNLSRTALFESIINKYIYAIFRDSKTLEKFQRAFKTLEHV